ncbi:MAG: hypothetical protein GXO66_10015 [Euryarchaeota archaeon]|nr:hypothetical protein [Euryarchaeota archaeon]
MRIAVFQRGERSRHKIEGVRRYGEGIELQVFSVPEALPELIDNPEDFLPEELEADLVLDYLYHPDLSEHLLAVAKRKGIPVIAPGRRLKGAITPPTCCGLGDSKEAGEYGRQFGTPELEVEVEEGRVKSVRVKRGAPCGATWAAAEKVRGLPVEEALHRFALEVQFVCRAAAGYEVGQVRKAPLHFAGEVHIAAFKRALER